MMRQHKVERCLENLLRTCDPLKSSWNWQRVGEILWRCVAFTGGWLLKKSRRYIMVSAQKREILRTFSENLCSSYKLLELVKSWKKSEGFSSEFFKAICLLRSGRVWETVRVPFALLTSVWNLD